MKLKLTENEKNRILNLHQTSKDNPEVITETIKLDKNTETAMKACGKTQGLNMVLNGVMWKIPWACDQWMIASAFNDSRADGFGQDCARDSMEVLLGPDREQAQKLLKLMVDKAKDYKECIESKGVDVSAILDQVG